MTDLLGPLQAKINPEKLHIECCVSKKETMFVGRSQVSPARPFSSSNMSLKMSVEHGWTAVDERQLRTSDTLFTTDFTWACERLKT